MAFLALRRFWFINERTIWSYSRNSLRPFEIQKTFMILLNLVSELRWLRRTAEAISVGLRRFRFALAPLKNMSCFFATARCFIAAFFCHLDPIYKLYYMYCHCEPDKGGRGNPFQPSTMPTFAFPLLSLAIYLLSCSTWIFGQWSQGWIKTKDKSMDLPL